MDVGELRKLGISGEDVLRHIRLLVEGRLTGDCVDRGPSASAPARDPPSSAANSAATAGTRQELHRQFVRNKTVTCNDGSKAGYYACVRRGPAIISRVAIQSIERQRVLVQTCRQSRPSVCRSVQRVYCGKTADWIWMPFGVVSVVSRGLSILDEVEIAEGEGAVLVVNVWHPVVISGDCGVVVLCRHTSHQRIPTPQSPLVAMGLPTYTRKTVPSPSTISIPCNTPIPQLTPPTTPKGIQIQSAVLPQTDRQIDRWARRQVCTKTRLRSCL